jgi:RNA polymerase sigma factor (sigma-70 family)
MNNAKRAVADESCAGQTEFSVLYEEHAERVVLYLAKRCLDPEVAVDLMAETFARAFEKRGSYRGTTDAQASAWIFGIAQRLLVDYFRRGKAQQRAIRKLGLSIPALEDDEYARIEELADLGAIRTAVTQRFQELSGEQREAIRLRVVEERPYPEVARRLDISEGTARARVSRGLRRLGALLDQPVLASEGASNE